MKIAGSKVPLTGTDGISRAFADELLRRDVEKVYAIAEEVENAFASLVQLEIHARELRGECSALNRALGASQLAYERGVIPLTDVLDANRQLLSAKDALAEAEADTARAAVGSFRALGGGWSV
jgi:outer membrane protein TolC